jgi:hypothetical protein
VGDTSVVSVGHLRETTQTKGMPCTQPTLGPAPFLQLPQLPYFASSSFFITPLVTSYPHAHAQRRGSCRCPYGSLLHASLSFSPPQVGAPAAASPTPFTPNALKPPGNYTIFIKPVSCKPPLLGPLTFPRCVLCTSTSGLACWSVLRWLGPVSRLDSRVNRRSIT